MITFRYRDITPEDTRKALLKRPRLDKRIENFVMMSVLIIVLLLSPLFVIDHFKPVAPHTQAVFCVIVVAAGLSIAARMDRPRLVPKRATKDKFPGKVEMITVQTSRAIKREDAEDFGISFYAEVTDNGQKKTLYLWGQYLDELESSKQFPNTALEITRLPGHEEFIEFKVAGEYFKEEKTLPAFTKEQWQKAGYPANGQLLNVSIDSIGQ
jgi:hypothetical protein